LQSSAANCEASSFRRPVRWLWASAHVSRALLTCTVIGTVSGCVHLQLCLSCGHLSTWEKHLNNLCGKDLGPRYNKSVKKMRSRTGSNSQRDLITTRAAACPSSYRKHSLRSAVARSLRLRWARLDLLYINKNAPCSPEHRQRRCILEGTVNAVGGKGIIKDFLQVVVH
jgi:hypothetical protein